MFSQEVLAIDSALVAEEIVHALREQVLGTLKRRGAVLGLSGGIDSSVVAALAARAFGKERVLALFMPDRDSSPQSLRLGRMVADHLGIQTRLEDITPILIAARCYQRQEAAIRQVFPDYGDGWKFKLTLPSILDNERLNVFQLTVENPSAERRSSRMPPSAYLELIAATNFKQRARKMLEYSYADSLLYAVAGTPNRLEYDQGFFVKQGDGMADFKPIGHLYKTQVYALAAYLGIPSEIRSQPPTSDTFSISQTQEEFYFALPYQGLDLCLYAYNQGVATEEVSSATGLSAAQVERVFRDIEAKRRATKYLHCPPLLIRAVTEV
jgi:NAD+ synthase